jgi:hypothetical protein
VNGHDENDFVHISRDCIQFDFQGFIIAIAFTGTVVTGVSD